MPWNFPKQPKSGSNATRPIRKKNTVRSYQAIIERFIKEFGDGFIDQITPEHILTFLNRLNEGNKTYNNRSFRPTWIFVTVQTYINSWQIPKSTNNYAYTYLYSSGWVYILIAPSLWPIVESAVNYCKSFTICQSLEGIYSSCEKPIKKGVDHGNEKNTCRME